MKTSWIFVIIGLFETLSGFIFGKVIDRHDKKDVLFVIFVLIEVFMVLVYVAIYIQSYFMCLVIGAVYGLFDNGVSILIPTVIGVEYNGNA